MCRVVDVVDGHPNTKFVWIVWQGDKVKMIAKARVTTHRGALADFFGQAHVTIDAATLDEVTEEAIMGKVSDASGSAVRVLKGSTAGDRAAGASRAVAAGGRVAAGGLELANQEEMRAAMAAVRSGTDGLDWALIGYQGSSNVVELKGRGTGGASELATLLGPQDICYGLVRCPIVVDNNDVTRFCMVAFVGEAVGGMRKGQVVTHKGQILEFLGQYHCDLAASEAAEVSGDKVMSLVQRTAGVSDNTRSEVSPRPNAPAAAAAAAPRAKAPPTSASLVSQPKKGNAVNTSSVALTFDDAIKDAIAQVRRDGSGLDWALIGYTDGNNALGLVGSGSGGADAMAAAIHDPEGGAYYGYLRVPVQVDGQATVKFVFVMYQGDAIKVVRKAKLATHVGGVVDHVGQYHLKLEFASLDNLTSDQVLKAVAATTGDTQRK